MTALDRNHLVSHNCRNCYQSGPAPLLLVTALASALMFSYVGKAYSASSAPEQLTAAQSSQPARAAATDGSGSGGMGWDAQTKLIRISTPAAHAVHGAADPLNSPAGFAPTVTVDRVTS